MEYHVMSRHYLGERLEVEQVLFSEPEIRVTRALFKIPKRPATQVVNHGYDVSIGEQALREIAADKTGASGDYDVFASIHKLYDPE